MPGPRARHPAALHGARASERARQLRARERPHSEPGAHQHRRAEPLHVQWVFSPEKYFIGYQKYFLSWLRRPVREAEGAREGRAAAGDGCAEGSAAHHPLQQPQ